MKCSLCGSSNTNKNTCPLNPSAISINYNDHYLANDHIKNIIYNIKTLEGPISANYLIKEKYPQILLLSDFHIGDGGCQSCHQKDGCYSLYDMTLLSYLDKELKIKKDLYLEMWSDNNLNKTYNSSLVSTVNNVRRGALKNINVHMVDIRHAGKGIFNNNKYAGDLVYKLYYISSASKRDHFKSLCATLFPDYPFSAIISLVKTYYTRTAEEIENIFWNHNFFKKYSRLHHELSKVPHVTREKIMTLSRPFDTENFYPIYSLAMVDMYTLARIFKSKPAEPEIAIIYLGGSHIFNIYNFLITQLEYSNIFSYGEQRDPDLVLDELYEMAFDEDEEDLDRFVLRKMNNAKCISKHEESGMERI